MILPPIVLAMGVHVPRGGLDCRKAKSPVERQICGDARLYRLDEILNRRYRAALKHVPDQAALRAVQNGWLDDDRDSCGTAACLEAAYRQRIEELRFEGRHAGLARSVDGIYTHPVGACIDEIDVTRTASNRVRFLFNGCWSPAPGQAPNLGELEGTAAFEGREARFVDASNDLGPGPCRISIRFLAGGLAVHQEGLCGFGMNVWAGGRFVKHRETRR